MRPGDSPPLDLFEHVICGGLIEAWNSPFEFWIWQHVCVKKYGWPPLVQEQIRDAAAKARAFALPSSLADAGRILNISHQKDKDGMRLLTKFSMPRNPTKNDIRKRIYLSEDPKDAQNLYYYNLRDIEAEAEISTLVPDLSLTELEYWIIDQKINYRGVAMDRSAIENCISIIDQARERYNGRLQELTNGEVHKASEVAKMIVWLGFHFNINTDSLDEEDVDKLLKQYNTDPLYYKAIEVLKIRKMMSSAAVSKLYTMRNQLTSQGRIHEMFIYHSARTGRAAGRGVQPQNLPNSGIYSRKCKQCSKHYQTADISGCPWCGYEYRDAQNIEWNPAVVEDALATISTGSQMLSNISGETRWH